MENKSRNLFEQLIHLNKGIMVSTIFNIFENFNMRGIIDLFKIHNIKIINFENI